MTKIAITSKHKTEMIDILEEVKEEIIKSGISDGICVITAQHTTASIMLFEKMDPNLQRDFLSEIKRKIPDDTAYSHLGGNGAAHMKASFIGSSMTIPVSNAAPMLGEWQGIFFCDFDGPRERTVVISVVNG